MRILIIISIFFIFLSCSETQDSTNDEVNDFISEFDGKSLDEIKEEVDNNIKSFESFVNFFEGSFSNEIEKIAKEDEKFEPVFKIDTTNIDKLLKQFDNVVFEQNFADYASNLEFGFKGDDYHRLLELGVGFKQKFIPQKIYYSNGDIRTDSISDYQVDFSFGEEWGHTLPIDSVMVSYEVHYSAIYDSITVNLDNPIANYGGGKIELVKAKDNYIYLTLSDTLAGVSKIQGINEEGKTLGESGYSSNGQAPEESKKIMKELLSYLRKLQKKLNNGTFKTTKEFQDYLRKYLVKLNYFNDDDGVYHKEIYFYGNVKEVTLYFTKNPKIKQTHFKAISTSVFGDYNQMPVEDGVAFINKKGKEQFKVVGEGFDTLNSRFYEDDDFYYHLNIEEKRMDTLLVYGIKAYENGLVGVQFEQEFDDYSLFNLENKQVTVRKYEELFEKEGLLFGERNDKLFIIDKFGKEQILNEVSEIGDSNEGLIVVENKNGLNGFMNSKGKIVIPMIYYDVEEFSDGLSKVQKTSDGNYGFIDKTGKVILPFIYKSAYNFVKRITAVRLAEGGYKLIDTTGKVLIEVESSSLSLSTNFGERVYSFGNGDEYDTYGILMPDDDEVYFKR